MENENDSRKTGQGSRVRKAREKGIAAAKAGKPREHSYSDRRPQMGHAWLAGYDSVDQSEEPTIADD